MKGKLHGKHTPSIMRGHGKKDKHASAEYHAHNARHGMHHGLSHGDEEQKGGYEEKGGAGMAGNCSYE